MEEKRASAISRTLCFRRDRVPLEPGARRIRLLVIRPMATAVFTVARDRGVTPYVRARESIHKQRSGLYGSRRFTYQPESNTYVCHEGQQLAVSIAEKNFFDPGRKFAPIFRLSS